jgi:hypothetical protein
MIASQEPRGWGVGVALGAMGEHAMCGQQSQRPTEGIFVYAGTCRELPGTRWLIAEGISYSEFRDHMQAPWRQMSECQLRDDSIGCEFIHCGNPFQWQTLHTYHRCYAIARLDRVGGLWLRFHHTGLAVAALTMAWFFVHWHVAGTTLRF